MNPPAAKRRSALMGIRWHAFLNYVQGRVGKDHLRTEALIATRKFATAGFPLTICSLSSCFGFWGGTRPFHNGAGPQASQAPPGFISTNPIYQFNDPAAVIGGVVYYGARLPALQGA